MDWKRYPYVPDWGDPRWFTFPDTDGYQPDLGVATYFVDGFLRGKTSGRQYAFMTIFTDMRVLQKRVRAAFYTFALYDCDAGRYGTYTDYDFPRPPRLRRGYKIAAAAGHLDLRYGASAGLARWANAREGDGTLRPFAWDVHLPGVDHHGQRMELTLDVDATRPPAPLGGRQLGGEMFFLGAPSTYSYFQSGLQMRGHLKWGAYDEEVEGTVGWIDRQWAEGDFSKFQDRRSTRYRNEWRVMQFDDGWDMSLFHQYHRHAHNQVVPWSGMSAQGPAPQHELRASHRVELIIPEFIRSPGVVRGLQMLTERPRWFPARYRVRIPEWDMDVWAESLAPAPAHGLPIEYWTGPVRISGTVWGRPVKGLGFDERSRPWAKGFELAAALRLTVEHLPGLDEETRWLLAFRAWEVEAIALRSDPAGAAAHYRYRIVPLLEQLPVALRERITPLANDLLSMLDRPATVP
jgi:predicted secreted hydrolase